MPSRLTRTAGTFALIAALAWLAVAPAAVIGAGAEDWEPHYTTLAVLSFVAAACTTMALFGLLRRPGGGAITGIALTLAILGTLVLGVVTWMWLLGVGLLTIASVIAAVRLRAARLGSAVGGILLIVAWPIGIAIAVALDLAAIGPRDSYGEPFLGQLIGYSTGAILFAAGLFACGRWLRSEAVVDVSDSMATA